MRLIDDNVLLFLNGHLGKNDDDAFERCSNFAYRDMCRTIIFAESYNEKNASETNPKERITKAKQDLRNDVTKMIKEKVLDWLKTPPSNFDKEHEELCNAIIAKYKGTTNQGEHDNSLYFGQAQKWVNMTLKNLYVYSKTNKTDLNLTALLPYMHIPIDNIVLDIAAGKKKCYVDPEGTTYELKKPSGPWSKWSFDTYNNYQSALKEKISPQTPILWELIHWSTVSETDKKQGEENGSE